MNDKTGVLVSFSLFLDNPPPPLDPRYPLDNDMLSQTYTTYIKDVLGVGEQGVAQAKEDINHLTKIDHFAIVHQLYKYIYSIVVRSLLILV